MSRFQAVRAAGENLQIRINTLLIKKERSLIGYILVLFDDLVESTLLAGGKSKKKRDGNLGFSARGHEGRSRICSCVHPPCTGLVM
jgi:hypothetical protein